MCCYKNGEKRCKSFLQRNCKERCQVSFTFKRQSETGEKSTGPKASTESEDKFLSYKQSLTVVIVSKPQLQLTGQVAATEPLLRFQNKKKRFKEVWAMKHYQWTNENWKKVFWSNESKSEVYDLCTVLRRQKDSSSICTHEYMWLKWIA